LISILFNELKKNLKKETTGFDVFNLAVLGNCSTQHLVTAIKGYAYTEQLALTVFDADYNQIEAQALNSASELYSFCPDAVLLYICTERLYEDFCSTDISQREMFARDNFEYIKFCWAQINSRIMTKIIQFSFVEVDDRVFGNYANKTNISFLYQIKKLNYLLMEGCQENKNVYLVDLNHINSIYGRKIVFDCNLYYIAKMPLTTNILPEVAKQVVDVIKAFKGLVKKCVIVDLDNTLWGGVIGDDGLNGIQIGELGLGHAFSELQKWLKELKNRGIILAVCSKNNEITAKEPFTNHPDMILQLQDIAIFVANWDDKATNIMKIQQTLNIGMDSIVFIDDNPFERNLVRSLIPEITIPELPVDPALYLDYLKELNLFETASFSDSDKDRARQYQVEINRTALLNQFGSYDDYLIGLDMVATAKPFDAFQYPRIAQLSQRSNQFNLRTVRYIESEIEKISQDDDYLTIYFTLTDKYGDYGLISVVILKKQNHNTLFIETWLMSCRVLKRGMEEFIVNKIIEIARENGFDHVVGEYLKTPKNSMVAKIYEQMGFASVGDKFIADLKTFKQNKTFIKE